jgi:hypothetical protein
MQKISTMQASGKTFSKDSSPLVWIWEIAPVRTAS